MAPFGRGDDRRERSASDREAARLERERRRAQRSGAPIPEEPAPAPENEPAPEEPPPVEAPVPDDPPEPSERAVEPESWLEEPEVEEPEVDDTAPQRPTRAERDQPPATEPHPATPAEPPPPPAVEPPAEPGAHERDADRGATGERRTVSLPRPQAVHEGQHTDSWDRPVGTVRGSRGDYLAQPGATGIPPHRKLGVSRRRRRLRRMLPLGLLLLLVVAAAVFAWLLFQPFHGDGGGNEVVQVRVPPGSGARDIGDLLADRGVVSSGFFFALRARMGGDRDKLRSGTYRLRKGMSYGAALDALTAVPAAAPVLKITLPEGPSRQEVARRVRSLGVSGSYLEASKGSSQLSPRTYGAPRNATLEGFLFPATYELRRGQATAERLVGQQLTAFKRTFAQLDLTRAKRGNLTRYDVLIIASMIEREASSAKDRRLISAVIYNRLRQGMPLGIDATIRYRLNNWSRPLRVSELETDSAFNTRTRTGLPPSPIGNPGLAALKAAVSPADVSYLFYVVKPCGNGDHAFSSTDAEFQRDVAAYERAREENGGKDPSRC